MSMSKNVQVAVTPQPEPRTGSSLDETRRLLVDRLTQAVDMEIPTGQWKRPLTEAVLLLEALPLSTSEFALAMNRLNNARRYLEWNERGAARYEVSLLIGGLTPKLEARLKKCRKCRHVDSREWSPS